MSIVLAIIIENKVPVYVRQVALADNLASQLTDAIEWLLGLRELEMWTSSAVAAAAVDDFSGALYTVTHNTAE